MDTNKQKGSDEDDNNSHSTSSKKQKLAPNLEEKPPPFKFDINQTLSYEMLFNVFRFMNTRELCKMAKVCKKWRLVAYDEFFWHQVDLSEESLNLITLKKFARHPRVNKIKSLKLMGRDLRNKAPTAKKSISTALMEQLKDSCANLRSLTLSEVDLNSIRVNDLPVALHELHLIRCELPINWFETAHLTELRVLDLRNSSNAKHKHLQDLAKATKALVELDLTNCYKIDDRAIEVIIASFASLLKLNLNGTSITDLGLHMICTRLAKFRTLTSLNLSNCKQIKDLDLNFITESFSYHKTFDFKCK